MAGNSFTLDLLASVGRPAKANGQRVSYEDVLRGVDLRYDVFAEGVKETLVLADANVPSRYRFTLTPHRTGST